MPQDPMEDLQARMLQMCHHSCPCRRRRPSQPFPILRLPAELIAKTLSNLSMKDRMNARVCKRLDAIEAEAKYSVKELVICKPNHPLVQRKCGLYQFIVYDDNSSSDFMRILDRVSNNASVGNLFIHFPLSSQIESDFYKTVKKFDVKGLYFLGRSSIGMMPEGFLVDMASKCHDLFFSDQVPIAELHEVYKGMADRSMKLRCLKLTEFPTPDCRLFFDLIGIRVEADKFFSNKDIEVYKNDYYRKYCIFDGDLCIEWWRRAGLLEMGRHETPDSLEDARNKVKNDEWMQRVDVAPMENRPSAVSQ